MKKGPMIIREMEDQIVPLLQNCVSMPQLKEIHAHIFRSSLSQSNFLATKIIDICNVRGETEYASLIFDHVMEPNVFLYNAMIQAYTNNHFYRQAIRIYKQMLTQPQAENPVFANRFTFPFVLKACACLVYLDLGKQVHGQICKSEPASNAIVQNSLIDLYTKCDDLVDARRVFDEMRERDVVSWNSLISANARLGHMKRARAIFDSMPDKSHKTIISWTTLISGYLRIGCYSDALEVFHEMQVADMKPDEISIIAVLPACAQLGALELGKWIHAYADKNDLLQKTSVCNALMEMYAKSGSIDQATQLFKKMNGRDVISWSTMIGGLANHGRAREAIQLFEEMERAHVKPNSITFLSILSACAHSGFLAEGLQYFDSMTKDYSITPSIEHYGCVVDLLGRSGCLDQAIKFINKMPIAPDATIWGSLLSACRSHGNIGLAIMAMEQLIELEPDDTGNFVLLSNTYAAAGNWEGVSRMRKLMRTRRMKKTPGCSLIEVKNVVHEFVAGDDSNPLADEIYKMLELLTPELSNIGIQTIIPDEGCHILPDVAIKI